MSETVDSLKQRLVGAFVILSLAIIFLPMIFDKPHNEGRSVLVPVPPKPEFKTIEIAKPEQPKFKVLEIDQDNNKVVEGDQFVKPEEHKVQSSRHVEATVSQKAKQATSTIESDKPSAVVASKSQKAEAVKKQIKQSSRPAVSKPKVSHLPVFNNIWMVQLGTFGNTSNAYRLRDKLRKDGFDAHTKEVVLGGKKAIKVFTGPFVKKREAERIKKKLDHKYNVESRLIFFDA